MAPSVAPHRPAAIVAVPIVVALLTSLVVACTSPTGGSPGQSGGAVRDRDASVRTGLDPAIERARARHGS